MVDFAQQDGTRIVPVSFYPLGSSVGGSYAKSLDSGTMAAGLAAAAPVFSFRFAPTSPVNLAVVRKVIISVGDLVGFTAGFLRFDMFAARAFSASDSGGTPGTLTGNNAKLRTAFPTTSVTDFRIASTATLTAGTRSLDTDPMASIDVSAVATAGTEILAPVPLWQAQPGECPLILANNEGFVVQATVPATGTWDFGVGVVWDELEKF